ncbi:MAG: AglZ/HisF2 family acetamidino modification protein [Deltaproteobacteria bacterium]
MLHPRIIPCLLVQNKGLVKTTTFKDPKYVGDPINAVKIFNEKEVDELVVLDIDATVKNLEPNYTMIENLAFECRMPLCYGGGIKNIDQALKIFSLGVEKISVSSAAIHDPSLVSKISRQVGNQSVVVILDVKKKFLSSKYEIFINNGIKNTGINAVDFAKKMEDNGVGEITINSIDNDGTMKGFDFNIVEKIREAVDVPLTILGGAGSYLDIGELIKKYGIIGAAAGSLFVFKGKYRAVLINYPSTEEKEKILQDYFLKYY